MCISIDSFFRNLSDLNIHLAGAAMLGFTQESSLGGKAGARTLPHVTTTDSGSFLGTRVLS